MKNVSSSAKEEVRTIHTMKSRKQRAMNVSFDGVCNIIDGQKREKEIWVA